MYTALQMITEAMNDIGVLAAGAAPTANQETVGLRRLNMMINSWSVKSIRVYSIVKRNFALAASTASYSYGSGETWDATRPKRIQSPAFIRDATGYDHLVKVIGAERYRRIHDKDLAGRPSKIFLNLSFENATAYVWPVPTTVENIYFDAVEPFTELASNAANCSFPPEYEEPLRAGLAMRLAPVYGVQTPMEIVTIARDGMEAIEAYNASLQLEPVSSDPLNTTGSTYDIRED